MFEISRVDYTVKPAYVVTSIKGSPALCSHIFWTPWIEIQCKWTCIKGSPVLSSQFSGFPWWPLKTGLTVLCFCKYWFALFKMYEYTSIFFFIFSKWDNFNGFLFPFLGQEPLLNRDLQGREINTVDSRYLEVEGTRWNTSRYPYFNISDVHNWGKYQTNNQISQMNM